MVIEKQMKGIPLFNSRNTNEDAIDTINTRKLIRSVFSYKVLNKKVPLKLKQVLG